MSKTLFDHLNALTYNKEVKWKHLTDADRKTFSVYMINRYLSMNIDWIEYVAQLQTLTYDMEPEYVYKLYQDFLPKKKIFLKYLKSKSDKKPNKNIIDYIKQYFECSEDEAVEYLEILTKDQIIEIIKKFGIDDKEIKQWSK